MKPSPAVGVGLLALSLGAYHCAGASFSTLVDGDASSPGNDAAAGGSGGSSGGRGGSASGGGSSGSSGAGNSSSGPSSGSGSGGGGSGSGSASGSGGGTTSGSSSGDRDAGGGSSSSSSGGSSSGSSSGGGVDASSDAPGGFACGPGLTCDPATSYCYHFQSNVVLLDAAASYSCQPLPDCDAADRCSCIVVSSKFDTCSCSEQNGGITDSCSCRVCAAP